MKKVAAFRDVNHDKLAEQINKWLAQNRATPVSISVTFNKEGSVAAYFHAFVVYEQ